MLARQAATDPLTGVLNRAMLDDRLGQARAQGRRRELPMTLLAIAVSGSVGVALTDDEDVDEWVKARRPAAIRGEGRLSEPDRVLIGCEK